MDYYDIIAGAFQSTIETIAMSVDNLATPIEQASQLMTQALLQDRKVFACGVGADAALAQLLCSRLMEGSEQDRPALPAFCLSGDASSSTTAEQHEVFSRQLRALGQEGDLLLTINSGKTKPALAAVTLAAQRGNIHVVALSNTEDRLELGELNSSDTALVVDAKTHSQTIELHTMTLNMLCQLVEINLFGSYNQD